MADRETTQELPATPKMGMVRVYDLDGNPHDMSPLNANDMVQHLGWSTRVAKSQPAQREVVVLVSKKNAPGPHVESEGAAEKVSLTDMDREELVKFAKDEFDMDFGPDVSKEDILNAIVTEQQG